VTGLCPAIIFAVLSAVRELVYEFIRKGGKLPVYARWIEGK